MSDARHFQLDELTIRPGTYFNPHTEVLVIVDDSPEVDHEVFDMDELEAGDWVLISEDVPLDDRRRDELVEQFQLTYKPGGERSAELDREDDDEEDDDVDVDVDELEVDELE